MRTRTLRALLGTLAASVATGTVLVVAANAWAAPLPPLSELQQARSNIAALEGGADIRAKAALGAANAYLGVATAASLWIDQNNSVPPPEGEVVFTDSTAAVKELKRIDADPTVAEGALLAASNEILQADADLAAITLEQVQGSSTSPGSSVKKWKGAFKPLVDKSAAPLPACRSRRSNKRPPVISPTKNTSCSQIPQPISGPALTAGGKPELFYYGAGGCPFCAIERWSMAVALAQFGKLKPLSLTVSSTADIFPATHTLSFYQAKYKSGYLAFVPVETATNQPCETCEWPWTPLQVPTPAEQELISNYDKYEYEGQFFQVVPFLDLANQWSSASSYADPNVIAGMSWQQVAGVLSQPASTAGQAIDGGAEILTAQICDVDGGQPAAVCNSGVVRHYQEELKSGFMASFPPP